MRLVRPFALVAPAQVQSGVRRGLVWSCDCEAPGARQPREGRPDSMDLDCAEAVRDRGALDAFETGSPVQPREVHQRLPEGDVEQREPAFEQRGEAPLDRDQV